MQIFFPVIKQGFDVFHYSETTSNIFQRNRLVKSMSRALNLGRLLCRSKFQLQNKNHQVKNCEKHCVSCPYLSKASLYQFKGVNRTFLLKNSFTRESRNLVHVGWKKKKSCEDEKFYMFPFSRFFKKDR